MIQDIVTNVGSLNHCTNCQRSGHETKDYYKNSNNKGERAHKQQHSYNASHDDYDQNNHICHSHQDNQDSFIAFMALTKKNWVFNPQWIC